jgi:hypothetical protein
LPTLEMTSVNCFGESGLEGIVETCIVVICLLARVGTFVEAVGQGCIRLGRRDGMLLAICPEGVVEREMTGLVTLWMVSLAVQPLLTS